VKSYFCLPTYREVKHSCQHKLQSDEDKLLDREMNRWDLNKVYKLYGNLNILLQSSFVDVSDNNIELNLATLCCLKRQEKKNGGNHCLVIMLLLFMYAKPIHHITKFIELCLWILGCNEILIRPFSLRYWDALMF
jgi:hypothetical protein